MRLVNITGKSFGLLTVTKMLPLGMCLCDCSCGSIEVTVNRSNLRRGLTNSCGCAWRKRGRIKHGESIKGQWSPEYRAWVNMITRCHNPKSTRFKDWGGRGVSVCRDWRHNYSAFLDYIGRRPSSEHSIHRPKNAGNYEPGNCVWATRREQASNTRRSRFITAFGKTATMSEWSEMAGLNYGTLWSRINDSRWPPEKALQEYAAHD